MQKKILDHVKLLSLRGKYKPAMSSEETLLRLLCSEKQFQIALTVHPRVLMFEINFLHYN